MAHRPLLLLPLLSVLSAPACVDTDPTRPPMSDTVAPGTDPDRQEPADFLAACHEARMAPPLCAPATTRHDPPRGADHVVEPTPIVYLDTPPASGPHRPAWARWGAYDYLPPQRWVHNLEHGGVAFLYDPCAADTLPATLRAFAEAYPEDESGPFRWVLTPYPGLPTPIAVIAWEWVWQADCLDVDSQGDLMTFLNLHYRQGPEDEPGDGAYATGWLGP